MSARSTVALAALVLALGAAGCAAGGSAVGGANGPAAAPASGGSTSGGIAAIVSTRCTKCHPIDRIKAANHDATGWTTTVTRMRTAHGAQFTDAEAQQVIEFLAGGGASQL
jgi:hypothetical protein